MLDIVRAELAATTPRQRALERKWVPLLTDALGHLETALDELSARMLCAPVAARSRRYRG